MRRLPWVVGNARTKLCVRKRRETYSNKGGNRGSESHGYFSFGLLGSFLLELLPHIVHLFSFVDTLRAELRFGLQIFRAAMLLILLTQPIVVFPKRIDLGLMALA